LDQGSSPMKQNRRLKRKRRLKKKKKNKKGQKKNGEICLFSVLQNKTFGL
jgi:hypothetical protein